MCGPGRWAACMLYYRTRDHSLLCTWICSLVRTVSGTDDFFPLCARSFQRHGAVDGVHYAYVPSSGGACAWRLAVAHRAARPSLRRLP